jgi:hypothetical protein
VAVHSDDIQEVFSLQEWLRNDRVVGGDVQIKRRPIEEGDLGGAIDVVQVVLGSGGAAFALRSVLIAWLRTRRPDTSITVRSGKRTVTVTMKDAKDGAAEQILKSAIRFADDK